ncbi:hypothetical protein GCM10009808_09600 [Microbacterium sediminicola]|uniref:Uncharacterized protein n=1 Tax=Microbacterium sediminicola TaxID=415210 RepID=A0ABN2HW75_9MICO
MRDPLPLAARRRAVSSAERGRRNHTLPDAVLDIRHPRRRCVADARTHARAFAGDDDRCDAAAATARTARRTVANSAPRLGADPLADIGRRG